MNNDLLQEDLRDKEIDKELERENLREIEKIDSNIHTCERIIDEEKTRQLQVEVEKERETHSIPIEKVEYQGLVLTEKGLETMRESLSEKGIELIGREQNNMHMTCEFFGFKPDADRGDLFNEKDLGKTVEITVIGFGEYRGEDGKVQNQGFLVDEESLKGIKLSDNRNLNDTSKNEVPHITVSISAEKDENGRNIAKAVNTWKCDFKEHEPIKIECRLAAFSRGDVAYRLEKNDEDKKEEKSDLKLEPPKEERTLDRDLERIEISKGAMTVIDVLHNEGYNADLVGGCVRDAMLGMKPKDEDITTNLEPDKVTSLFEREGYQVIPTGIEHGTVTVMVPNDEGKLEGYEITTYRIDGEYKDGRHPDGVSFTDDIKEDLSRRDFTINAIAYDPRGEGENRIKDPFNGRDDIKNGVIRAVGDPRERIKEDALRMMRAVRFSAQKDMEIDKDLKSAIKERAEDIRNVSKERINAELSKILVSDNAREGISNLRETGLLREIIPSLDREYDTSQNNPWHLYDVGRHTEKVIENTPNDKITRLAAAFHDLGKTETKTQDDRKEHNGKPVDHFYGHPERSEEMTREVMKDLRFTTDEIKNTCLLVKLHDERLEPDREKICRFIEKHPEVSAQNFDRLVDLQRADMKGQNPEKTGNVDERMDKVKEIYSEIIKGPYRIQDLALDGKDIGRIQQTTRGDTVILSGQDLKVAKEKMLSYVLREPEKNNATDLQNFLRNNLKTIKNDSINRQDDKRKEAEKQAYKTRSELDKTKRELQKIDIERLKEDRELFTRTGDKSSYIEKVDRLVSKYNDLYNDLKKDDKKANPRLSDEEKRKDEKQERYEKEKDKYNEIKEKYCKEFGYSNLDYNTHEFYADRGEREHLPPEQYNPDRIGKQK